MLNPEAMSPLTASDLQRIFETLDSNGDGFLSVEELNRLLDSIGDGQISDDLESLIGKCKLDFEEFLSLYKSISERNRAGAEEEIESDLLNAFQVFDQNRDGFICCEELRNVLARLGLWDERCGRDCSSMIGAFDINFDGRLDFQEFKNMMLSASNSPCI